MKRAFDSKCYDLVEHFYPVMSDSLKDDLASDIQELVEGFGMCGRGEGEATIMVGPDTSYGHT